MTDPPWLEPATGARLTHSEALARLAGGRAALLGEHHHRAADHRWQAAVIAGLAALRAEVAVGFEMFPRRAQPALDAWGAGRLDEAGLLERTRWQLVVGIIGRGHLEHGHGTPAQLADLGIGGVAVALPAADGSAFSEIADLLFFQPAIDCEQDGAVGLC